MFTACRTHISHLLDAATDGSDEGRECRGRDAAAVSHGGQQGLECWGRRADTLQQSMAMITKLLEICIHPCIVIENALWHIQRTNIPA